MTENVSISHTGITRSVDRVRSAGQAILINGVEVGRIWAPCDPTGWAVIDGPCHIYGDGASTTWYAKVADWDTAREMLVDWARTHRPDAFTPAAIAADAPLAAARAVYTAYLAGEITWRQAGAALPQGA